LPEKRAPGMQYGYGARFDGGVERCFAGRERFWWLSC
jgi:hypothetical protein